MSKKGGFLFLVGLMIIARADAREEHLCGPFYIEEGFLQIFKTLDPNEKKMACGEDGTSWSDLPLDQTKAHLRALFRQRGFFSIRFRGEGGRILVDLGKKTEVREIAFSGAPEGFYDRAKLQVIGEPLSSDLLDQVKSWTVGHLRSMGYPCPEVDVSAGVEGGRVAVMIEAGEKKLFSEILFHQQIPEELGPEVLSRAQAYLPEQEFNYDLPQLTARRLMRDGTLRHSYFSLQCGTRARMSHFNTTGKPRLLTIGFGASTEEGPLGEVKWRHARLDKSASSLTTELKVSLLEQLASVEAKLYLFDRFPHLYFYPHFEITRRDEDRFEYQRAEAGAGLGYERDDADRRYILSFSPTYNYDETTGGTGPGAASFISFDTSLSVISHYYEFYALNPRSGYHFNVQWRPRRSSLGADVSVDYVKTRGTVLFNWAGFDPPSVVYGWRWLLGTTGIDEGDADAVTVEERFFLGGDDDIRGFSRNSISNEEAGFLSAGYLGGEIRLLKVLPFKLQPFFFVDAAKVGKTSWNFDKELYWAPGLGIRWESPVGAFRFSFGRGYIEGRLDGAVYPEEDWVFFASYGKVF